MEAQNHREEQAEQVDRDWLPGANFLESAAHKRCPVAGEAGSQHKSGPLTSSQQLHMTKPWERGGPSTGQSWD